MREQMNDHPGSSVPGPSLRVAHVCLGRPRIDTARGVDKTIYALSKAQAAIGNGTSVLCLSRKPPLPIPGVDVRCYAPLRRSWRLPAAFVSDLRALRPDIVHLHSVYTPLNVAVARMLRGRGIPYVVRPAGGLSPVVQTRRPFAKIVFKYLFEVPMLRGAAFVHSVGDAEDIRNYCPRARIVSTGKGVEVPDVSREAARSWLHERIPQARGAFVFVYLGRLDPLHKGLDLLIEGFGRAGLERTVLIVAGPDRHGSTAHLARLADEAGVAGSTVFVGPVFGDDKLRLVASADAFVHPSRWEGGIPHSILEAAALGRPIVTTAFADRENLLVDHGACLRVEATAAAIGAGLRSMALADADTRERMGASARRLAGREFVWEAIARQLEQAYRSHL
jgi:glycosyltransferase involved in cell wall biosynthesis